MTPDSRRTVIATLIVAGIAAVVFLVLGLSAGRDPFYGAWVSDSLSYHLWAERLAAHGLAAEPAFHQAPLWPALLAAAYAVAGSAPATVLALQFLLAVCAIACYVPLGVLAFDSRRAGVAAALLALLHGPLALHALAPLPVVLAVATQLAALLVLGAARRSGAARPSALAGAAWGLAALARPEMLAMVPLAALAAARPLTSTHGGRDARRAGLVVAGALLVIAPVTAHNLRAGGGLVPIASSGGENLYAGNRVDGDGGHTAIDPMAGDVFSQRVRAAEIAGAELGREPRGAEISSYWVRRALREIADEPGAWLRLEGRKIARMLSPGDPADLLSFAMARERDPVRFAWFVVPPAVLWALGLVGAGLAWRRRDRASWPIAALVALHVAVLLAFFVSTRLRLPLFAALAPFAGFAVDRGLAAWEARRHRRVVVAAGLAVLAAAIATPLLTEPPARERVRLAAVLSTADRGDDALEVLTPLLVGPAPDALALDQAGWIRHKRGEWDAAVESYRQALRAGMPPAREPALRLRLAEVLERVGRPEAALDELDAVVGAGGAAAQVFVTRARLLERAGDIAGARRDLATALRLDPGFAEARRALGRLADAGPG